MGIRGRKQLSPPSKTDGIVRDRENKDHNDDSNVSVANEEHTYLRELCIASISQPLRVNEGRAVKLWWWNSIRLSTLAASLLRLLTAFSTDTAIPLDLNSGTDVTNDHTAQQILAAVDYLVQRLRKAEGQGVNESLLQPIFLPFKPATVTDVPLAGIPCPTCGRLSPSALSTDSLIVYLEPPPELPYLDNKNDELVFLRNALPPLSRSRRFESEHHCPRSGRRHGSISFVSLPERLLGLVRKSKWKAQALVLDVEGTWREPTGVVNKLAANLTNQVRSIAKFTKTIALGDLSKQIEVNACSEILHLKNTYSRERGDARQLAGRYARNQASVPDIQGIWEASVFPYVHVELRQHFLYPGPHRQRQPHGHELDEPSALHHPSRRGRRWRRPHHEDRSRRPHIVRTHPSRQVLRLHPSLRERQDPIPLLTRRDAQ
ncbi:hypothetical protein H0H92_009708, partial [Tricholoma furcatifolium]